MIPDRPDALLRRRETAAALTEAGFPIAPDTLATKATRGGGPPYQLFGAVALYLYQWGEALDWARSRLSPPRRNTSESDAAEAANAAKAPPIAPQSSSDDTKDKPVCGSQAPPRPRGKASLPPEATA
jgi:hypothetical protein